ncbi:MAG: hypothetical protein A2014_07945 [Spirochaetes bacterium GWF1_49_6]|nr:MAG: hypothetical protein A2014_07945 [Spirochaetes bacterium GWF1_49_6]
MKRLLFVVAVVAGLFGISYGADPEVSKKSEIAVFGVYSSYNMPSAAVAYFDDQMIGVFNDLKRFKVIGFQYRMDEASADKFIKKIKELKKEQILNDKNLIDEDFGVVVIPAVDLEAMTKSFFIAIPIVSGWSVTKVQIEKKSKDLKGNTTSKWVWVYKANVNVSIRLIDADGTLVDKYSKDQSYESETGEQDAYQHAIKDAVWGLTFFLRNMDQFKIKTKVLEVPAPGTLYMELGKDMGVLPGYEFIIEKSSALGATGKTIKMESGLVRVESIGADYSIGKVIFGSPIINDQLVEAPMMGGRLTIGGGIGAMNVAAANIQMVFEDYSPTPDIFTTNINLVEQSIVPHIGIAWESEIGYALLGHAELGLYIGTPLALNLDLGVGYEIYLGPLSIVPSIDLSIIGNYTSLGTYDASTSLYLTMNDQDYSNPVNVDLIGATLGAKPKLSINIQFSQGFKLRLFGGYALYFLPFYQVKFTDTLDENKTSTIDITDSHLSFLVNGVKKTGLPIDYNGVFAGAEFVFRF